MNLVSLKPQTYFTSRVIGDQDGFSFQTEFQLRNVVINISRTWEKEKIWVPNNLWSSKFLHRAQNLPSFFKHHIHDDFGRNTRGINTFFHTWKTSRLFSFGTMLKCTIRDCNWEKERSIFGKFFMCLSTFCLKVHCFLNRVKYNDGLI